LPIDWVFNFVAAKWITSVWWDEWQLNLSKDFIFEQKRFKMLSQTFKTLLGSDWRKPNFNFFANWLGFQFASTNGSLRVWWDKWQLNFSKDFILNKKRFKMLSQTFKTLLEWLYVAQISQILILPYWVFNL
jgi:hypothetical protein